MHSIVKIPIGGLFDDLSDEEYARLLGLVREASNNGEARFPKGAYESSTERMVPTTKIEEMSGKTAKATTLDGAGASVRMRLGTIHLPKMLLERIRDILRGSSPIYA